MAINHQFLTLEAVVEDMGTQWRDSQAEVWSIERKSQKYLQIILTNLPQQWNHHPTLHQEFLWENLTQTSLNLTWFQQQWTSQINYLKPKIGSSNLTNLQTKYTVVQTSLQINNLMGHFNLHSKLLRAHSQMLALKETSTVEWDHLKTQALTKNLKLWQTHMKIALIEDINLVGKLK